tara:strand:+ start:12274 stop:12684 length:411 start_codon:yes stop_codon:yes gene_type:complete
MSDFPPITISSLDLERLERLLDSDRAKNFPGADDLRRELDRADVVEPGEIPPGIVTMNSTARFRNEDTDANYEMTLVYPDGAGAPNSVSILAPIGSALLGLSVGQSISWQLPAGKKLRLQVLEVVHQPEQSGELHR